MSQPSARVAGVKGSWAQIDFPREVAEREGLEAAEELSIFAPGAGTIVLSRQAGRKGLLVARLGTLSVAELFGFIGSGLRSGAVVVQSRGERRRIGFQDGQVIFAASTDLSERLGPVLWRKGLITLEQLEKSEPKVTGGAKLGQVLVEDGVLTPAQLYRGFQLQVREIALGAFLDSEGELAFIEGECAELNTVRLRGRTRDLALEGLARAERIAHFRQTFDLAAPTSRTGAGEPKGIDQVAIYEKSDGKCSLRDVVRASRLGEYTGLLAVSQLVQAGVLHAGLAKRPAEPDEAPARVASGPLELYLAAVRRVCQEVRQAGGAGRLRSYFEELSGESVALFDGVFGADADELDVERLSANAQQLRGEAMGRAVALEALDGLLSFALFDARNVLDPSRAAELSHAVARLLRGR